MAGGGLGWEGGGGVGGRLRVAVASNKEIMSALWFCTIEVSMWFERIRKTRRTKTGSGQDLFGGILKLAAGDLARDKVLEGIKVRLRMGSKILLQLALEIGGRVEGHGIGCLRTSQCGQKRRWGHVLWIRVPWQLADVTCFFVSLLFIGYYAILDPIAAVSFPFGTYDNLFSHIQIVIGYPFTFRCCLYSYRILGQQP